MPDLNARHSLPLALPTPSPEEPTSSRPIPSNWVSFDSVNCHTHGRHGRPHGSYMPHKGAAALI